MKQRESANFDPEGIINGICEGHGHTQVSRIGELIDNPLDQGATFRQAFVTENYFGVYDNGKAVSEDGLKGFRTLYASKERKDDENGKYNIGMAAAIASQVEANQRLESEITYAIFSKKKNADVVRLYGMFHKTNLEFDRCGNASSLERIIFEKLLEFFEHSHGTLIVMAKNGTIKLNTDTVVEIVDGEEISALHPDHVLVEVLTAITSNTFSTFTDLSKKDIIHLWHRNMHSNCILKLNNDIITEGAFLYNKKVINLVDLFSDPHVSQKISFDAEFSKENVFFIRHKEGNLPPELESIKNVWCEYRGNQLVPVEGERPIAQYSFVLEAVLTDPMTKRKRLIGHATRYYERCKVGISQRPLGGLASNRYIERFIWNLSHKGFQVGQNKSIDITLHYIITSTLKSFAQFIIVQIFKQTPKHPAKPQELDESDEPNEVDEPVAEDNANESPLPDTCVSRKKECAATASTHNQKGRKKSLNKKRRGASEKTLQKVLSRQRNECAITSFNDIYLSKEIDHHNNDPNDNREENLISLSASMHSMKHVANTSITKQNRRFSEYYKETIAKGGYANGVGYSPTAIADQMYQVMNSRGFQTECLNQSEKRLIDKEPDLFKQAAKVFQQVFPNHKVPTYQLKVTK